ncbi:MAG: indole-3-glycerol phosphate synthase TrpC [Actinomycetota bacterium]|nr:indole-3-glycerol phosphate synthase TrpC [Actinomycetota bacterium]
MSDFLEVMMARRRDRIQAEYGDLSPADRERLVCCARPVRDFAAALRDRADIAVIAEIKKASPSAGPIAPDCEASKQALHYQRGGAAAVSVLTEPESFGGSFADLSDVADAVDLPVLCKDFIVDPVQLFVARGHGADAVLLMVSVLGHMTRDYADIAETLGLTPVVEIATSEELTIALGVRSGVVAVNSRDLRTLEVDPERACGVLEAAQRFDLTLVAASGVKDRADVEAAARAGADAVLVGETLMRSPFPEEVLEELTGVARSASRAIAG